MVEGTKLGCGRRSGEAEEEGEKKRAKNKEVETREERERKRRRDAKGVRRCMKGWKCR